MGRAADWPASQHADTALRRTRPPARASADDLMGQAEPAGRSTSSADPPLGLRIALWIDGPTSRRTATVECRPVRTPPLDCGSGSCPVPPRLSHRGRRASRQCVREHCREARLEQGGSHSDKQSEHLIPVLPQHREEAFEKCLDRL